MSIKKLKFAFKYREKKRREKIVNERCDVLVKVIKAIQPIYFKSKVTEQSLIETMVGAAIWYVPRSYDAWTGKISFRAIKSFHPRYSAKPKLSEEHIFPRKLAARQSLRDTKLTETKFRKLFRSLYGKLHYVTPVENKRLVAFQKGETFFDIKNIYRSADVELIKISKNKLINIKKRNKMVIENLLEKGDFRPKNLTN